MREADDELARIRTLAHLVVERFGPLTDAAFGRSARSRLVAWVEGFVERHRAGLDSVLSDDLAAQPELAAHLQEPHHVGP